MSGVPLPASALLTLDQPLRQIFGHRLDHLRNVRRLGQHLAAIAGVLQEAVHPLVAAHVDMGDRVDPQPRRLAPTDAAVEQIDPGGNFGEHRVERLVQQLKPGDLGVVQIDHDACALGLIDACLPQRFLESLWLRLLGLGGFGSLTFTTPHVRQRSNRCAHSQTPPLELAANSSL